MSAFIYASATPLARGQVMGALHGVPTTITDFLDTVGVITTGDTTGRAGFVPIQEATVVARLRAAGAVLLGKTNTPELILAKETDNLIYGRTNNPYDLSRTPGAVAARRRRYIIGLIRLTRRNRRRPRPNGSRLPR